jgi:hypothetical protein
MDLGEPLRFARARAPEVRSALASLASGYPLHHPRRHYAHLWCAHGFAGGSATIPLAKNNDSKWQKNFLLANGAS